MCVYGGGGTAPLISLKRNLWKISFYHKLHIKNMLLQQGLGRGYVEFLESNYTFKILYWFHSPPLIGLNLENSEKRFLKFLPQRIVASAAHIRKALINLNSPSSYHTFFGYINPTFLFLRTVCDNNSTNLGNVFLIQRVNVVSILPVNDLIMIGNREKFSRPS